MGTSQRRLVCVRYILNLTRGEAVDALCTERSKDTTVPIAATNTRERSAMAKLAALMGEPCPFRATCGRHRAICHSLRFLLAFRLKTHAITYNSSLLLTYFLNYFPSLF